jgi:hypothetical protein
MRELGVKTSVVYLIGMIATAVVLGLIVDATMGAYDWTPNIADAAHGEHIGVFHWAGMGVLLAALVYVWWRELRASRLGPSTASG